MQMAIIRAIMPFRRRCHSFQWLGWLVKVIAFHVLSRHAFADRATGVGFVVLPSVAAPSAPFPVFERSRMSSLIDCVVQKQQSNNNIINVQRPLRSRCFAKNNGSQYRSRRRDPDMRNCKTIEELLQMAYVDVDSMSPRGISAFWALLSKLLQRQNRGSDRRHSKSGQTEQQMFHQFDKIIERTLEDVKNFGHRDLSQTAISLAKIVNSIDNHRGRLFKGSPKQMLKDILIGNRSEKKQFIFDQIAQASRVVLPKFDSRSLSNFIYAYAKAGCSPKFEDGSSIFDLVAVEAIPKLKNFNSFDMSNMLWAYATANESNTLLFKQAGDAIVAFDNLDEFKPQALSNLVWAYATAKESHPDLLKKVADHISGFDDVQSFNEQGLSNLVWAYATAKESHPDLLKKIADHIAGLDNLRLFKPQALANILWAYTTAKEGHPDLFKKVADHIAGFDNLESFKPQEISNIVWAYATAKESHPDLFKKVADHISGFDDLESFNPQDLSNTIWAYATAEEAHPKLFEKVADHVAGFDNLESFNEQGLSNLVWAYATAKEPHPHLFMKVADRISGFDDLESFNPQDLSNTIWAYATAKEPHPDLFKNVALHIAGVDNLQSFTPQALSNLVWAYATAKEPHPKLFEKVAGHITGLGHLGSFTPQALSNLVWAYATAKESQPELFEKVADHIIALDNLESFKPQALSIIVWAYAANGQIDKQLFASFIPTTKALIGYCNIQDLANIAWSFAVADVDTPSLFNDDFIDGCLEKRDEFNLETLCQLHQWHLWQEELKSTIRLPPSLEGKCYKAFVSEVSTPSALQNDVISTLSSMGLNPEEEVLTPKGYSLDAVVEVNGEKIGIEVDGPFHFLGRKPTGSTILKRRQIANLEKMSLVSVPYWEWNKLGTDINRKQKYLSSLLGL